MIGKLKYKLELDILFVDAYNWLDAWKCTWALLFDVYKLFIRGLIDLKKKNDRFLFNSDMRLFGIAVIFRK